MGSNPLWLEFLKNIRTHTHTEGKPCEDTRRRKPSKSQGKRPQKKSLDFQPLGLWEINFCCLSYLGCAVILCYASPSWLIQCVESQIMPKIGQFNIFPSSSLQYRSKCTPLSYAIELRKILTIAFWDIKLSETFCR